MAFLILGAGFKGKWLFVYWEQAGYVKVSGQFVLAASRIKKVSVFKVSGFSYFGSMI